tara:strand:- start:228 stop:470 length:243 start_codon:yes stop_codon:yes gene_type:complete
MTITEITKAFKLLGFLMANTDYDDGLVDPCDMHNIMMLMNKGVSTWQAEEKGLMIANYNLENKSVAVPCNANSEVGMFCR